MNAIGAATSSREVYADCEYGMLEEVLLCPPSFSNPFRETNHGLGGSMQRASSQLRRLQQILESEGIRVNYLTTESRLAYQCYMRDSSLVTPWGLALSKMSFEPRAAEPSAVEAFALERGADLWLRVTAGTLEGGDVQLLRPGLAVIGVNKGRTSAQGAKCLREGFNRMGWTCEVVTYAPSFVHLDLVLAAIDQQTLLLHTDAFAPAVINWFRSLGFDLIEVSASDCRRMGCNVLSLDERRIISTCLNGDVNLELGKRGYTVIEVELSEFVADEGGVHCLTLPWRRQSSDEKLATKKRTKKLAGVLNGFNR